MYFNFRFSSLLGIVVEFTSSPIGLKICPVTAGIKKCKSIIHIKKKKHDKIVLLSKCKLNSIEVLIYNDLIHSNVNHDEFISINNVLKE